MDLIRAISKENPADLLATVQSLLDSGYVDVNETDDSGDSALVKMVRRIRSRNLSDSLPIVRALLAAGADVCSPGRPTGSCALCVAIDKRLLGAPKQLLTLLVKHLRRHSIVCQCRSSALRYVAEFGTLADVKLLIGQGDSEQAVVPSTQKNLDEALCEAVERKNVEIAELLIDRGASVNCSDKHRRPALLRAFLGTDPGDVLPMVEFLLGRGINVWRLAANGSTALHYLCRFSWREGVEDLRKCAALLLDAAEKQRNSVEAKETQRKTSCACFIDLINESGNTALDFAVLKQNAVFVKVLLDHGADCSIKADNGNERTALEMARDRHPNIHSVFVQFEYIRAMRSFLLCHRIACRHVGNKAGGRRRSSSSTDETSDSVLSCLPDLPASMIAQFMLPNELRKKEYRDREL